MPHSAHAMRQKVTVTWAPQLSFVSLWRDLILSFIATSRWRVSHFGGLTLQGGWCLYVLWFSGGQHLHSLGGGHVLYFLLGVMFSILLELGVMFSTLHRAYIYNVLQTLFPKASYWVESRTWSASPLLLVCLLFHCPLCKTFPRKKCSLSTTFMSGIRGVESLNLGSMKELDIACCEKSHIARLQGQ